MALTSIHIKPVKGGSEEHNRRTKRLDYVRQDLPHDYWQSQSQEAALADIKERYRIATTSAKHPKGQSLQKKATPIREGVVVVDSSTTMADLHRLAAALQGKFGIRCFQIALHLDEGHYDNSGVWHPNRHAHMVFDWTNTQGKTIKLNAQDMAKMQTLIADVLGMERGKSSDKTHLDAVQQKLESERTRLAAARADLAKTNADLDEARQQHEAAAADLNAAASALASVRAETETAKKERERKRKAADKESGSRTKKAGAVMAEAAADLGTSLAAVLGKGKYAERAKEIEHLKKEVVRLNTYINDEPRRQSAAVAVAIAPLQAKYDQAYKQWGLWEKKSKEAEKLLESHKSDSLLLKAIKAVINWLYNAGIDSMEVLTSLISNKSARYTGEIRNGWSSSVGWADNAIIERDDNGKCTIDGYEYLHDYIRYHPKRDDDYQQNRGWHM